MNKALVFGIDEYPGLTKLVGCARDATKMAFALELNGNGGPNFNTRVHASDVETVSSELMKQAITELFRGEADTVLLYFAGHGVIDAKTNQGYLVSQDGTAENWGVSLEEIMERANRAHPNIRSTIILLDCCHAGIAGEVNALEHQVRASLIGNGVTVLAACHRDELTVESSGQGRFTQVLLEGLRGGASDVLGEITPASLYAYVDQALGAWEQRPVYKANVQQFTNILTEAPKVRIETLRKLPVYFPYVEHKFQLDPSFEPDRGEETKQLQDIAVNPSNVQIYREMQSCNRYGLIAPTDYPHMWHSAVFSGRVELTALGSHIWRMAKKNRL